MVQQQYPARRRRRFALGLEMRAQRSQQRGVRRARRRRAEATAPGEKGLFSASAYRDLAW